ncbi:MAG TPA: hypothetical protein VK856_01530 [Anaerolineaceae bacterium]|nr:hypothetical protein [Anaerolineaceae bacterium]
MQIEQLIKYEHIHSLIQHRKFNDANLLLDLLAFGNPSEPLWYGLRVVIASENHQGHELEYWHKSINHYFPLTVQAKLAEALKPGTKIPNAIRLLREALKMDVENAYLHYFLGNFYRMQSKYHKAIGYYDRCLVIDKDFLLAYPMRLDCYHQIGDVTAAMADIINIVTKSPEMNSAYMKKLLQHNLQQLDYQSAQARKMLT